MKGIVPVVITPFKGGIVDILSMINLLEYLNSKGASQFWMFGTGGEDWSLSIEDRVSIIREIKKQKSLNSCEFIYGIGNLGLKKTLILSEIYNDLKVDCAHYIQPCRVLSPKLILQHYKKIKFIYKGNLWGYFSDNYSRSFIPDEWNYEDLKSLLKGIKISTLNISNLKDAINQTSSDFILPAKAKQFFNSLNAGAQSTTSIEANVSFMHLNEIYTLFKNGKKTAAKKAQETFDNRAASVRTKLGSYNFMNIAEIKYVLYCNKLISSFELSDDLANLSENCKSSLSQLKVD